MGWPLRARRGPVANKQGALLKIHRIQTILLCWQIVPILSEGTSLVSSSVSSLSGSRRRRSDRRGPAQELPAEVRGRAEAFEELPKRGRQPGVPQPSRSRHPSFAAAAFADRREIGGE